MDLKIIYQGLIYDHLSIVLIFNFLLFLDPAAWFSGHIVPYWVQFPGLLGIIPQYIRTGTASLAEWSARMTTNQEVTSSIPALPQF